MFALALIAATLAVASPVAQQKRSAAVVSLPPRASAGKIFNPDAVRRERHRVHRKYKGKEHRFRQEDVPMLAERAVEGPEPYDIQRRATSGVVPLTDFFDTIDKLYYGPLSVGTPTPQTTTVDFDTGFSDLWLPLSTCSGCPGPLFDASSSKTFKQSSQAFAVHYGDTSSARGNVATDTVTVAGLTVSQQGFGAVTSETGNFLIGPNAGLLGLGFPANADSGKTPFFHNLANNGALASNVFAFYMARNNGPGSELCIGCTNSNKYTGSITYYTLDSATTMGTQYYWNIKSGGFYYNGGSSTGSFSAVIDSGTTLIYIPTSAVEKFYAKIPGSAAITENPDLTGFYTYPCNTALAPITIQFGTTQYEINPADFNLGALKEGSDRCVAGIAGEDVDANLAVVGAVFMKNWYSVFSLDKKSVGFAKAI